MIGVIVVAGGSTEIAASPPSLCVDTLGSVTQLAAASDIAVSGNHAYAVDRKAGLLVYDVSIADDPIQIGSFFLPDAARVVVSEGFAYVITTIPSQLNYSDYDYWSELWIFCVESPSQPALVGRIGLGRNSNPSDHPVSGFVVADGIAYVAPGYWADWRGIKMIDVSDPSSPTLLTTYDQPGTYSWLAAQGTKLYLGYWGLTILDVSDPANPSEISEMPLQSQVRGVAASDDSVFLSTDDGLLVVDVSDPESPVELSLFPSPEHWSMECVYVVDGIALVTYYRYLMQGKIHLIDVTDPTTPTLLSDLLGDTGMIRGVGLGGGLVCVQIEDGIGVIDISVPGSPVMRSTINRPKYRGAEIEADHIFVFSHNSTLLRIFAVPSTGNPFEVASFEAPGIIEDVIVDGEQLLIAAGASGVGLIDISNPAMPAEIVWITPSTTARVMALSDDRLYLSSRYELVIIDVSNPQAPQELGLFDVPSGYRLGRFDVADGFIVAIATDNFVQHPELWTIDARQPALPLLMATTAQDFDGLSDVKVSGSNAFVSGGRWGMKVFELEHPNAPILIATGREPDEYLDYLDVEVDGKRVFVSSRNRAFQIFDVSNPDNPVHKGTQFPGLDGTSLSISDGRACLLLESSQLVVLDVASPHVCSGPQLSPDPPTASTQ